MAYPIISLWFFFVLILCHVKVSLVFPAYYIPSHPITINLFKDANWLSLLECKSLHIGFGIIRFIEGDFDLNRRNAMNELKKESTLRLVSLSFPNNEWWWVNWTSLAIHKWPLPLCKLWNCVLMNWLRLFSKNELQLWRYKWMNAFLHFVGWVEMMAL